MVDRAPRHRRHTRTERVTNVRIRLLHPEFFSDATLASLPDFTRLIFVGLWLLADREGRLLENYKAIDGALLPLDQRSSARAISELAACGRILRYETPVGPVIQVVNFLKYQHIHPREKPSKLPGPASGSARKNNGPGPSASTSTSTSTSRAQRAPSARASARDRGTSKRTGPVAPGGRAARRAASAPAGGSISSEQQALLKKHGLD